MHNYRMWRNFALRTTQQSFVFIIAEFLIQSYSVENCGGN